MTENLFELAARKKFRFQTPVGDLTVEDLYDLPLISLRGNNLDLDKVARAVNEELKGVTTESFVQTRPDPRGAELEAKLEIVKTVIAYKQDEAERARARKAKADQRQLLNDAIAAAKNRDLAGAPVEELEARLAALDADEA